MRKVISAIALAAILCMFTAVTAIASEHAVSEEAAYPYSIYGASFGFTEQENGAVLLEGVGYNGGKYSVLFNEVVDVITCTVMSYDGLCNIPVFLLPKYGTNVTVKVDSDTIIIDERVNLPTYDLASYFPEDGDIYYLYGGGICYIYTDKVQDVATLRVPDYLFEESFMNGGIIDRIKLGEAIFFYGVADKDEKGDIGSQDPAEAMPFTDVDKGKYYYEPVLWAVRENILSGTSPTFSPDENCPRGEVVTYMWRAMGEPEPALTSNPFTDVSENDYYYKAVLWAYEQGITTGTSATAFSPESPCTRGQVVTFLWRAEGEPVVSTSNTFEDVSSNAYYADSVNWAVEKKITTGTSATEFSPEINCTRGHIITFLYRNSAGE